MPPITHSTLRNITIGAALIGQFTLDTSPQLGILLCGVALFAALVDGWWYLQPLGKMWWWPAMWGLVGLSMWSEPRGWFFMAWAAIELGTSSRAQRIITQFERHVAQEAAEERARQERLAALGLAEPPEPTPDEPEAAEPPPPPLPPIPLWRYPLALALGLLAGWIGAWGVRFFFHITGWSLDLLAIGSGYLIGKAITAGAGDRSNLVLRWASLILSVLAVLYGRFLMLSYALLQKKGLGPNPKLILQAMVEYPAQTLGISILVYVVVGGWAGWHFSREPQK